MSFEMLLLSELLATDSTLKWTLISVCTHVYTEMGWALELPGAYVAEGPLCPFTRGLTLEREGRGHQALKNIKWN
jgi:hypothetical protein